MRCVQLEQCVDARDQFERINRQRRQFIRARLDCRQRQRMVGSIHHKEQWNVLASREPAHTRDHAGALALYCSGNNQQIGRCPSHLREK